MSHTIRRTLLTLGAGVAVQRTCQLVGFLCAGRALGVTGLGVFAQGLALAAVLSVIAGAGVRNTTARTLAANPHAARMLVLAAVRRRLAIGGTLAAAVIAFAAATATAPWFWCLCALHVVPGSFDLKNLLDTAGRARREVAIETAVAVLQLLATGTWAALGDRSPTTLAAISLTCRSLYAIAALPTIHALRATGTGAKVQVDVRTALGQTAHELLTLGDVWLVALTLGDAAAGFYAFAVRFAAAALVPSGQLARLLLPHLLHAGNDGNTARTLTTALRATALATLPMLGGGALAAPALCTWAAPAFADSAPALQLLLLAGCLQHLGWQCSHALLAQHRDRAFGNGLLLPAAVHTLLLAAGALAAGEGAAGATFAAATAAIAQGCYCVGGLTPTSRLWRTIAWWRRPLLVATATTLATGAAALAPVHGGVAVALQLVAGGITFALGLWCIEVRGRWQQVGDGLADASGFRA